jgi:hypothetical protein
MISKGELQSIAISAAARLAEEKARKEAIKSQIEHQKRQLEADDWTNRIRPRILEAAEAGRNEAKVFEWKQGEGVTNNVAPPPIESDSVAALVLSYCAEHHGDLNPEIRWLDYRPSRPFGPYMHVWGIFLNWA